MRKEIEKYELIEQYLHHDLVGKELAEVNQRIENDPDFAAEVEQQRMVMQVVEEGSYIDIRDKIQSIHQQTTQTGNPRGRNGKIILGSGLIIILSTIMITVFVNKNKNAGLINSEIVSDTSIVKRSPDSTKLKIVKSDTDIDRHETIPEEKLISNEKKGKIITADITQKRKKSVDLPVTVDPEKIISDEVTNKYKPVDSEVKMTIPEAEAPLRETYDSSPEIRSESAICDDINITARIIALASCEERPTGTISVEEESIMGGTPPYSISIDNANYYYQYLFENLHARIYNLSIKDKNNCLTDLGSFKVLAKECYLKAFAPDEGERWTIPDFDNARKITIFNKNGKLVFEQILDDYGSLQWTGNSNSGDPLPMGLYSFILEFSNEPPMPGNVTIIR